jgi:hypothetical protein
VLDSTSNWSSRHDSGPIAGTHLRVAVLLYDESIVNGAEEGVPVASHIVLRCKRWFQRLWAGEVVLISDENWLPNPIDIA